MGDYNLTGLNQRDFEHLVQALAKKEIAAGVIPFGDGKDGGREATFEGKMEYPSKAKPWDGYLVIQCKFCQKPTNDSTKDGQWAIKELKKELNKFLDPKRNLRKPDYYLYVTNLTLTPAYETGSLDRVIAILKEYASKLFLKGYDVWSYDNLCRFLDGNEGIRRSYAHFITPGDILSGTQQKLEFSNASEKKEVPSFLSNPLIIIPKTETPLDRIGLYLHQTIENATPEELAKWMINKLSVQEKQSLALIGFANILAHKYYLKELFSQFDWDNFIQDMQERGLLVKRGELFQKQGELFQFPVFVEKIIVQDTALVETTHHTWVSVLAPKLEYWDLALALCMHLLALKEWTPLVECACNMILAMEDSKISCFFFEILKQLQNSKFYRQLNNEDRILLLNVIGIHETHQGQYQDALKTFKKMLKLSRTTQNNWGIGQALLNRGVTWAGAGDNRRAEKCYRQAEDWARKQKDEWLLGRILNNLSVCQTDYNIELALLTLEESIRCKEHSGDKEGLDAAYMGRGILAANAGYHQDALKWFRQSEQIARRFEQSYTLAQALHNQANSLCELGKYDKAIKLGEQAHEIALELDRKDLIILTSQGRAMQHYYAGNYEIALPFFAELYELKKAVKDISGAITALSDVGHMEFLIGNYEIARNKLQEAIHLARTTQNKKCLPNPIQNYVTTWLVEGKSNEAIRFLKHQLTRAENEQNWTLVIQLTKRLAEIFITQDKSFSEIDSIWMQAANIAEKQKDIANQVDILRNRYAWIRDTQTIDDALNALQPLVNILAKRSAFRKEYIEVLNELGNGLQQLWQYTEAEKNYRKALALAEQEATHELENILNNLAELLRKTNRIEEAIPLYRKSIELCISKSDIEERLFAEHNLALALDAIGEQQEAVKLLQKIREETRRKCLWEHHGWAWLYLANIAWLSGQNSLALQRYTKAKEVGVQHNLNELVQHTVLNEARLLQELNRSQQAIENLQSLQGSLQTSEYCPELFLIFGECHIDCKNWDNAVEVLQQGISCSQIQHDSNTEALLYKALDNAKQMGKYSQKSRKEIETALSKSCSLEQQDDLLLNYLFVVSRFEAEQKNKGTETQAVLDQIKIYAKSNERTELVQTAYQLLGDTLWNTHRENAIQAYLVGMIEARITENIENYLKAGFHLQEKLYNLGLANRKHIVQLMDKAKNWLCQHFDKSRIEDITELEHMNYWFLSWFEITLKLLDMSSQGKQVKLSEMEKILQQTFLRSISSNQSNK